MAIHVISIPTVAIELNTDAETLAEETTNKTQVLGYAYTSDAVEQKVRSYFEDIPIMAEVAWCESRFTQINSETGEVKRGHMNAADVGVMQINEYYHQATADKLQLNLHSLEDNLAYARFLYEREGTTPWNASRPCWHKSTLAMR